MTKYVTHGAKMVIFVEHIVCNVQDMQNMEFCPQTIYIIVLNKSLYPNLL